MERPKKKEVVVDTSLKGFAEPGSEDENRTKEAIEERRVSFLFDCYENGISEMCHRAGDWYFQRDQFVDAFKHYKYACEKYQFGMSCFNYALLLASGKEGVTQNPKLAHTMLGEMCQTDLKSCMENAQLLEKEGDFERSATYFKMACDNFKDNKSCHVLSTYYITGKPGITKNMGKAFEYASKACELQSMFGCANVSKMYKKGEGVSIDEEKAKSYKKKAITMEREKKHDFLKEQDLYSSKKSVFEWLASKYK